MKNKRIAKILFFIVLVVLFALPSYANDATRDIVVILDPGHGGSESGAVAGGIIERDVNWKIAKRVKEILDNTAGITGILARDEWSNPSLYDRGLLAKNSSADLLVSFHINSSTSSSASGAETYITGNPNSSRFNQASNILGRSVLANLREVGVPTRISSPILKFSTDGELYSDGYLSDYYGIIRNPMYYGIPGVLIEHCYISNPNDRARFLNDGKINQMAEADAKAIIANKELFRINRDNNSSNSTIDKLTINDAKTHLVGEATIVDWINGMQTIPSGTPSITLKTTDNTATVHCYVTQVYGNKYYFDVNLAGLDDSKEYKIEVTTQDRNNIPKNATSKPSLGGNRKVGEVKNKAYYISNSAIKIKSLEYIGDLNTELYQFNKGETNGATYISGEIVVVEWVDGKSTVPTKTPKMRFKSTDGTVDMEVFVTPTGTNTYYFDRFIEGIDTSKEYKFYVESTDKNNISEYRVVPVYFKGQFANKVIGTYQDKKIKLQNNKIIFTDGTYIGNLNTELYQFNKGQSGGATYVSGEIVVVEWVDGKSTVPTKTPKMRFKSTDGTVDMEVFVTPTGTNTYYFDRFIEGIDTSKEYKFYVESTDKNNISEYRVVPVYFKGQFANKVIGNYADTQIVLENNQIVFKEIARKAIMKEQQELPKIEKQETELKQEEPKIEIEPEEKENAMSEQKTENETNIKEVEQEIE